MEGLASVVAARRKSLALTQADAAALAGVSERFVREVEGDKKSLRLDKLVALLGVLGLELVSRVREVGDGR